MPTKSQLLSQLHSLRHTGFFAKLETVADAHNFPLAFFFAIASRETNCLNILGDFRNHEAHGVGIIQIDIQHPIARAARDNGDWETAPEPLLHFGAEILASNIKHAEQEFLRFSHSQHLKIAASGYNCGIQRAINASKHGDSDRPTTGHDYGRDTMTRMAIFEELLAENN